MLPRLARLRVPLGFACAVAAYWLAAPTRRTLVAGATIAAVGELLRIWAAGHIEKGREVTGSGPYRHVRHPLYLGSAIMAAGFAVAAASAWTTLIVVAYFAVTYVAAVRTEEATLDARFDGQYAAYRHGVRTGVSRRFSGRRAFEMNREYRAVAGLAAGFALLWWMV